jgi:Flp pilus assembly protein protease CpaA
MNAVWSTNILIPTILLLIACGFDLKTGKFPNWLFLVSAGFCALLFLFLDDSYLVFANRFLNSFLILLFLSPLVLLRALGGGDLKFLGVFGFATNLHITLNVLIASLFWGLLIGILRMALSGELATFTQSFVLRNPQVKSQKIPYTFALLLGWLTFLSTGGVL